MSNPASPLPGRRQPMVAIIGHRDIYDTALASLTERAGCRFDLVDINHPDRAGTDSPDAVIVRSVDGLRLARTLGGSRRLPVALLHAGYRHAAIVGDPTITAIPECAPDAAGRLGRFLTGLVGEVITRTPVHVTERELEILRTYTLGATLRQTSRQHQIAESTVREHYRRVARRYEDAGLPVGNKAQMLLRLMADGWVASTGTRHTA